MPAKAGTDADAESISGSETRCPGERPGKRQLKAWLDTAHPGWQLQCGLQPKVQPDGKVEWRPAE